MNAVNTAAGVINAHKHGRSDVRQTTIWIGMRSDGKFVVASRWQYEIITSDRSKAERKFSELVKECAQ